LQLALPHFICFLHVAASVTIIGTEAHENCNHLLRAVAYSRKALVDADDETNAAGLF
jgi:hypothetical protein